MVGDVLLLAVTTAQAHAEEEVSKLPFYLLGGGLALWGIVLAVFGMSRGPGFPGTKRARNLIMAVTVVLVLGACGSAALTG